MEKEHYFYAACKKTGRFVCAPEVNIISIYAKPIENRDDNKRNLYFAVWGADMGIDKDGITRYQIEDTGHIVYGRAESYLAAMREIKSEIPEVKGE